MNPEDFHSTRAGEVRRVPHTPPYRAFFPSPLPRELPLSPAIGLLLSRADQALGRLAGAGQVLPDPHLVSAAYRRREAVASSAIEGTQSSLTDVLSSEASTAPPRGDVREVINYIRAFDHGIERLDQLPLGLRLVREIHQTLLEGVRGTERTPGDFRTSQNWIGPEGTPIEDSVFVPPPPDAMQKALTDWERFLHDEVAFPPLIQCALMHYQFETIHPFGDGNGRIGRLLIGLYLVEREILPVPLLYVSPYLEARRAAYYDLLQRVRQAGDFEAWIGFFLEAITTQALDALGRAERLIDLLEDYRRRLRDGGVRGRAPQFVDQLVANPFVTAPRVSSFLQMTQQGAAYLIGQLSRAEILRPVGRVGRTMTYVAYEVLDILEGRA